MRRLNLLRQLLLSNSISTILELKPSTRLMSAVLIIEFSRRRWAETIHTSRREFLQLCGYSPSSRYAATLFGDFLIEGSDAGFFTAVTRSSGTAFTLKELGIEALRSATARALERYSVTDVDDLPGNILASLPRSMPTEGISARSGAVQRRGNERNEPDQGNQCNAGNGNISPEKTFDVGHSDHALDSLSRELAELGL